MSWVALRHFKRYDEAAYGSEVPKSVQYPPIIWGWLHLKEHGFLVIAPREQGMDASAQSTATTTAPSRRRRQAPAVMTKDGKKTIVNYRNYVVDSTTELFAEVELKGKDAFKYSRTTIDYADDVDGAMMLKKHAMRFGERKNDAQCSMEGDDTVVAGFGHTNFSDMTIDGAPFPLANSTMMGLPEHDETITDEQSDKSDDSDTLRKFTGSAKASPAPSDTGTLGDGSEDGDGMMMHDMHEDARRRLVQSDETTAPKCDTTAAVGDESTGATPSCADDASRLKAIKTFSDYALLQVDHLDKGAIVASLAILMGGRPTLNSLEILGVHGLGMSTQNVLLMNYATNAQMLMKQGPRPEQETSAASSRSSRSALPPRSKIPPPSARSVDTQRGGVMKADGGGVRGITQAAPKTRPLAVLALSPIVADVNDGKQSVDSKPKAGAASPAPKTVVRRALTPSRQNLSKMGSAKALDH